MTRFLFPVVLCTSILSTLAVAVPAQCQFQSVTLQRYGAGCSEVFGFAPTLLASLDTTTCELTLTVDAYGGCCNTFLDGTLLLLGLQPVAVPLMLADPACALLARPDLVFGMPGFGPGSYVLPIPPGLPPITLYAQGAGTYYTTILFPLPLGPQFSLTAGYSVTLQ